MPSSSFFVSRKPITLIAMGASHEPDSRPARGFRTIVCGAAAIISGPRSRIEPSSAPSMAEIFSTIQSRIGWSSFVEATT